MSLIKKHLILVLLFFGYSPFAMAKNLGVFGEVFPIKEHDLLQLLQDKVRSMQASGELEKLQQNFQEKLNNAMDRPTPVKDIKRTVQTHIWNFDPSITMPYDIKDTQGNIVIFAGSRFNPLDNVPLTHALIFYNADDANQVKWAQQLDKQSQGKDKLILVGGSIYSQMALFHKPIYFDQNGRLTTRFHIKQVPAFITQEGKHLKISEVLP